jgi:hypothetical protein
MAAVSLFWRSSGVLLGSSGVLLAFFWVLLCYRTPEEPRRTQKEKNTSPPANDISIGGDINGD